MPQTEFQPTIPVFERAKNVHALDRVATVISIQDRSLNEIRMNHVIHIKPYFQGVSNEITR
jgi:hypothetical protein